MNEDKEQLNEEIKKDLRFIVKCVIDLLDLIVKIMINIYFCYLFMTGMIGIQSQGLIFPEISRIRLFFYFIFLISSACSIINHNPKLYLHNKKCLFEKQNDAMNQYLTVRKTNHVQKQRAYDEDEFDLKKVSYYINQINISYDHNTNKRIYSYIDNYGSK